MAVKASVTITISKYRDTDSITRYYKLQASTAAAPAVPTTLTPSGWSTSEPTYTSGSTNTLYYTDCVVFSDGTFQYTDDGNGKAVKSSSYEAAKEAYNKAQAAQNTADTTQENLDNLEVGNDNLLFNFYKQKADNTQWSNIVATSTDDLPQIDDVSFALRGSTLTSKYFVPYDKNKKYKIDMWFKCLNPTVNPTTYFYPSIIPYDMDKNLISTTHMIMNTNMVTTLSEDLNTGDTIVHATDINSWPTDSSTPRSYIGIFNYKSSNGYEYDRYTRNILHYADYQESRTNIIDKTNNTIKLKNAYNGPTIPAGTKIAHTSDGSTYIYPFGGIRRDAVANWVYKEKIFERSFDARLLEATYVRLMPVVWQDTIWVCAPKMIDYTTQWEAEHSVKSITNLYYASDSTTLPSKPSSHITTNNVSTRNAWNIALPTYNEAYPYLYTCKEVLINGGTYSWTSVEQTTYAEAMKSLKETTDNILNQKSQNGGKNIHLNDSAEDYFIKFKQKGNTHIKNGIPKPIKALPSTYQRLRYVEVPQEAYIDLGISMSTNYSMETKIDGNGSTTNNQFFLGESNGYLTHLLLKNAENGRYIGIGNHRTSSFETTTYKYEDGQPMIIETIMKPKLICKVNNNIIYEDSQNMTDYTSSYNGILFAYRDGATISTSNGFKGRCYYFKLFDQNGNLIRDLIPCYEHNEYEGTDQEEQHLVRVGFYDRVTETFLTNSGTGTFIKGANVGDLRTDISDGDKRFQTYNFTLEGNNLNADDYLADDGIHIVDKSITVQSGETSVIIDDIKDDGHYYCNVPATLEGRTLTFGSALSSDVVILYESSSETVIPYTDRQQDEYEHIINLYTYKDNTNIYSDGNLEIEYVRNNGLNIYQLKSDSEKRYKITNEKIATIENENGEIKLTAENAKNLSDDNDKAIKQLQKDLNEFKVTSEGVQNTLKSKGGNNLALYTLELWTSHASLTESDINEIKSNSLGGRGYILGNGTSELNIPVPNGTYTISFKYKKIGTSGTTATVKINDETPGTILTKTVWGNTYALTSSQPEDWVTNYKNYYTVNNGVYYHVSGDIAPTWTANTYYKLDLTDYIKTVNITNNNIKIEIIGNSNNMLYMCDLMVNPGEIAETWTQNPNETRTDTVTIGKGIKVENSNSNTYTKIDDDGTRVFNNENKDNPEEVARFTKEGINVKEIVVREKANISGIVIQEIGGQTWITSIL